MSLASTAGLHIRLASLIVPVKKIINICFSFHADLEYVQSPMWSHVGIPVVY